MFVFRSLPESMIRYEQDDPPQGGGGGSSSAPSGQGPEAAFQRLLDRNSQDGIALARQLFAENHDYREEIRQLKGTVTDLQGKVPGEGGVILSAEEAQKWEALKQLGEPEEVKQAIEERNQLQEKVERAERETTVRAVAEAAGYRPSVLMQLASMEKAQGKDLAFEVREEQQDGESVKVPYVKDGETEKRLADYASEAWADFLPSLASDGAQESPGATQQASTQPGAQQQGIRYPQQHPGGSNGSGKGKPLYQQYLEEQNEKAAKAKNPLRREET